MGERRISRAAGKAKRAAREHPLDAAQGEAVAPTSPDARKARKSSRGLTPASRAADAEAAEYGGRIGGPGRYWLLLPKGVTK